MAQPNEVELGDQVKDTISGFKGICVGVTKWLHGCRRIAIQPQELKDGKPIDAHNFDEPQVEILKRAKFATTARTGGPGPTAAKRTDVTR